jgi:hypothetical protein
VSIYAHLFLLQGNKMKRTTNSGSKYFYAIGQSARARGLSKAAAESYYMIETALPYARIAFDAGYRGL